MQQMIVASGLGKHMQALTACWLSGVASSLHCLPAAPSREASAILRGSPLGRRTFVGLVVVYAIFPSVSPTRNNKRWRKALAAMFTTP